MSVVLPRSFSLFLLLKIPKLLVYFLLNTVILSVKDWSTPMDHEFLKGRYIKPGHRALSFPLSGYSPTPCHQALPEPQFPEDVHDRLHRGVVCDSERAQVQNSPQLQWMWAVGRQLRGLLCEVHDGIAHDALLSLSGIL